MAAMYIWYGTRLSRLTRVSSRVRDVFSCGHINIKALLTRHQILHDTSLRTSTRSIYSKPNNSYSRAKPVIVMQMPGSGSLNFICNTNKTDGCSSCPGFTKIKAKGLSTFKCVGVTSSFWARGGALPDWRVSGLNAVASRSQVCGKYSCYSYCFSSKSSEHGHEKSKDDTVNKEGEGESKKRGPFRKLMAIVNHFWIGCKQLLWTDVRKALATRKKLQHSKYDLTILSREELRHMRQTKKDMIKSLPVALLFFVPFVGYFAPIIGYIFPKRLLSQQFWNLEQRKKFAFEDHVKRSQYYLPLIKEVGWSSREIKDDALFRMCMVIIEREHPKNIDLIRIKDGFEQDVLSIEGMPRFHLVKLSKTWLLPAKWYIPRKVLREYLISRLKHVLDDDMLIRKDGIDALTDKCVKQACQARGLNKSAFKQETLRNWLADWVELTSLVSDKDLSFLAHCAVFKSMHFGEHVSIEGEMETSESEEDNQIYAGKEHELIESYKKNEQL